MFFILTILSEVILIGFLILFLYKLKPRFGLAPLYIYLGSNRYFQTILSNSIQINFLHEYTISPGAAIIFSSTLFAVLLIYIKEGPRITQRLIIGITLANFAFMIMSWVTNFQQLAFHGNFNTEGIKTEIIQTKYRTLIVGTIALVIDSIIIVILYKFFFFKIKWLKLFGRLLIAMLLVFNFDSILYILGSYWGAENLQNRLVSNLISKSLVAVFFAMVLYIYLRIFDNNKIPIKLSVLKGKEDFFSILTYQNKYERLKTEKEINDELLQLNILDKTNQLEKSIQRFTILSAIREHRVDKFSTAEIAHEYLLKIKEAFEVDACTIHLYKKDQLEFFESTGIVEHEKDLFLNHLAPYLSILVKEKKCLAIEDTSTDPVFLKEKKAGIATFNYISCLGAPLFVGDKILGLLKIYSRSIKRTFSEIEFEHFQLVSSQIANSILNTQLYEQNEKHKEILIKQMIARKKAEDLITESEEKYRALVERVSDAFIALDKNWNYTYVNKKAGEIFGRNPDQLLGKNIWTEFPDGFGIPFQLSCEKAMIEQQQITLVNYYSPNDKWFENQIYPSENGLSIYFKDVTESIKVQEEIKKSEEKYRSLVEQASDAILIIDTNGNFLSVNNSAVSLSGFTEEEFKNKTIYDFVFKENLEVEPFHFTELKEEKTVIAERLMKRKNASPIFIDINAKMLKDGNILVFVRDISERKIAEQKIINTSRLYLFISKINKMILHANDDATLFKEVCDIAVEVGNFKLAWIGLIDTEANNIYPVMNAGIEDGYLTKTKNISILDMPGGSGPLGLSVRNNKHTVCNNIATDAMMAPWKEEALQRGYLSSIAIPIMKFGKTIGTFSLYAGEIDFFNNAEIYILQEATNNLSFALESLEKELQSINAAEEIKNLKEKYFSIISSVEGIVWEADAKTFEFSFVSNSAEKILGYPVDNWTSQSDFWSTHIYENDRNWAVDYCVQNTIKKQAHEFEYRMVAADGKIVWLKDVVSVIVENDEPVRLIGVMVDITESKNTQNQIKNYNEQLHLLTNHLITVREEERRRIGREIHDDLGQQLTAIKMDVAWIDKKIAPDNELLKVKIKNIIGLLDGSNLSVRRILNELKPSILDEYGLANALELHGQLFSNNTGITHTLDSNLTNLKISEVISTCIFRVFQESLTNITRYAHAKNVISSLQIIDGFIQLIVTDDGIGFNATIQQTKNTFGILGMKERARALNGKLEIISTINKGTRVMLELPFSSNS